MGLLFCFSLLGSIGHQKPLQAGPANQPPAPPAVYYGALGVAGLPGQIAIEARIDGQLCGRGDVIWQGTTANYLIPVQAASNESPECGAPGRSITFYALVTLAGFSRADASGDDPNGYLGQ